MACSSESSSSSSSLSSSSWMITPNAADRALQLAVGPSFGTLDAKTIIYYPRGGGSRSIEAIIEYPGPAAIDGLLGGSRPVIDIYVKNDSISGISSAEVDTGGDKVDVPMRFGLSASRMRIVNLIGHDKAVLHVQAQ